MPPTNRSQTKSPEPQASRAGASAVAPAATVEAPIASPRPAAGQPIVREISVSVPIAPVQIGKYVSRRLDTDLTHSESVTCRRIQDAIEATGVRCTGPVSVLKFLLGKIGEATQNEA